MIAFCTAVAWKVASSGNLRLPRGCMQLPLLSVTRAAAANPCWRLHPPTGSCGSLRLRVASCEVCTHSRGKFSLLLWSGDPCLSLGAEIITFTVWIYCVVIIKCSPCRYMYVCEMVGNTVKLCGWFYIKDSILGKEFVCCTSIESNHVYFL